MIYSNVEELAKKKGISLSELERRAEMSKGSISKWKTSSPTIGNLSAVASVLGVSVNRLLKEQ